MGSSYSDLYLYFKVNKDDTYGIPKNGDTKKDNQIFTVKVSKSNYDGCVNFEKVTHTIEFKPPKEGLKYNILLNDSCDTDKPKGKNVFGYYYPSNDKEVLSQLHVYYSVLDPNDPLVVSFVTRGTQTYNFLYSGLLSTRWVRAYSISYYSLSQQLSKELLTNEFRKSHRNRKIQFVTEKSVKEVSGFKQKLQNDNIYRYIYFPNGDKSVLGSDCLCKLDSKTPIPLVCTEKNKSPEAAKPSETANSSSSVPSAPTAPSSPATQAKSPTNYDNKIDPYYLDFVNGHYYDGVILYYVKNGNQGNPNGNNQTGSSENSGTSGQTNEKKDNYDHNMAVLLELIDKCNTKTHIKRKDKNGNWWSQEKVEYNDDKTLKEALEKIKKTACDNDSTTFILERTSGYKGVSKVDSEKGKNTYTKYTHTAIKTNIKTNLLFRKSETKIGDYDTSKFKTQSLEVYFLKIDGSEQGYPFILMFTYQNDNADKPAGGDGNSSSSSPQAASGNSNGQTQQSGSSSGAANGTQPAAASQVSNGPKPCKKCYFSSENYDFTKWLELKNDKTEETATKEKPEKNGKQSENNQAKELEDKLNERLDKIEQYGKCTNDINILRSIAYQVLIGVDKPDPTKSADPEPPEERPKVNVFRGDIGGTSLPVVLGSVAAGLVVLGTISAIIYGIYWYNTTIKLLT